MKSFFAKVEIFIFRPKTMDYSPWFDFWESKKCLEIRIPSERASQGERNGANFSSAPLGMLFPLVSEFCFCRNHYL